MLLLLLGKTLRYRRQKLLLATSLRNLQLGKLGSMLVHLILWSNLGRPLLFKCGFFLSSETFFPGRSCVGCSLSGGSLRFLLGLFVGLVNVFLSCACKGGGYIHFSFLAVCGIFPIVMQLDHIRSRCIGNPKHSICVGTIMTVVRIISN